jgi:hypothetical protein
LPRCFSSGESSRNDHQSIEKLIVTDELEQKYICNSVESQATSEVSSALTFFPFRGIEMHKILFKKKILKGDSKMFYGNMPKMQQMMKQGVKTQEKINKAQAEDNASTLKV